MDTKYLVLDANAFYSYVGRHKLGLGSDLLINKQRLDRLFDKSTLFISSSVLTEVFVRFRNNLEAIRDIICFLTEKKFSIITASTDCVDEEKVDSIIRASSDFQRRLIINEVLKSKARIETYVVYVFAGTIASILGDLLIEDKILQANAQLKPESYSKLAMQAIVKNREKALQDAENDLINAYSINKEESGMKNIYDGFLALNLAEYEKQLFDIEQIINPNPNLTLASFQSSLNLSCAPSTIHNTLARYIAHFKKRNSFKDEIESKILSLAINWDRFDAYQKAYIITRFEIYLTDTKFKKNDVFDTLFLGCLKDENINEVNKKRFRKMPKCSRNNYHLISFDKEVSFYLQICDWKGSLIADRIRVKRLFPDIKPTFSFDIDVLIKRLSN